VGKLYVVGIGPGDPELMTLKAVRILKEVSCIFVPKGREEGTSLALSIVQKTLNLDDKEIVEAHFPMRKTRNRQEPPCTRADAPGNAGVQAGGSQEEKTTDDLSELDAKWNETVEVVLNRLARGIDAAFITIGDPAIYSTFFYLYDRLLELEPSLNIEIVPGISSINAAAARAGLYLGLGNDRIAILPANYLASLQETLEEFDTVVLMKVNKVFDSVRDTLIRMNLSVATYVARAGMKDERIFKDIRMVKAEDLNYFSLVIVRKR
jgi:precorrin-2/cobalt-factor-2 C20-methyltransferase